MKKKLSEGWSPRGRKWDMVIYLFDNLGFKSLGGKKVGYEQFTTVQIISIPRVKLIEWGIYPSIGKVSEFDNTIWNNRTWDDERKAVQEDRLVEMLGPQESDYDNLNNHFLSKITYIISILSELPNYNAVKAYVNSDKSTNNECNNVSVLRKMWSGNENLNECEVTTEVLKDDVGNIGYDMNVLDINHATPDVTQNLDLNSLSTVKLLAQNALNIRKNCLDDITTTSDNEHWKKVTPIMESVGVAFAGDGSPSYAASTLKDEEPDKWYDLYVNNGGWHNMLIGERLLGKLFGPTICKDGIYTMWRPTEAQKKWVFSPGDPRDAVEERNMVHLAIIEEAARCARLKHGIFGISAIDVVDHMLNIAEKCPIRLATLIDMQYGNAIEMMMASQTESNIGLYASAVKILATVHCSGHAIRYARLDADFLVWYYCASPAEKILYAKALLTRKTKNGKNIFTDCYFENFQKDIRSFVGKYNCKNLSVMLENAVLTLGELLNDRSTFSVGTKSTTDTSRRICGRAYMETRFYLVESGFWKAGELKCFDPKKKKCTAKKIPLGNMTTIDGKIELNTELCSLHSIGYSRLMEYLLEFKVKGELHQVERSSETVNLDIIDPFDNSANKQAKRELKRCATVNPKVLESEYNVDLLKDELIIANRELSRDLRINVVSKPTKLDYVHAVRSARLKVESVKKGWLKQREKNIKEKIDVIRNRDKHNLKAQLQTEVKSRFLNPSSQLRVKYSNRSQTVEVGSQRTNQSSNFGSVNDFDF